jgi:hypothetical protein
MNKIKIKKKKTLLQFTFQPINRGERGEHNPKDMARKLHITSVHITVLQGNLGSSVFRR